MALRASPCAGAKAARKKTAPIRQKQEIRFLADLEKLGKRIALGRLRTAAKIYEAIGRLKERYPRVARYYEFAYDQQQSELSCTEDLERKQKADSLDGSAKEQPQQPECRRHLAHLCAAEPD